MASDRPPPSKGSRTRVYSVVLVIVTVGVVAVAVLIPVVLERVPMPPAPPPGGPNVKVDNYASGSGWEGQFGDDPTVAVAPDGTVAVAWEGLNETAPPSGPGMLPTFTTSIFVSFSTDAGSHYSSPRFVGSPGSVAAFLPALAFAANGTLFLAYVNSTDTVNQAILVTSEPPGGAFSTGIPAIMGQELGRPWLSVLPSGAVVLAFEYNTLVEWTVSRDGGRSFQSPTILLLGLLTGGTQVGGGDITLVGLSAGALTFTTVSVWSVTINPAGTGTAQFGTAATITLPYPAGVSSGGLSRPGPTVAMTGGVLYLLYASANESTLSLETSTTNGTTWAGPWALWSAPNTTVETPVSQAGPGGTILALSWTSTQSGFWNTYAALYDVRTGLLSPPSEVSGTNGLSSTIRNWHGTFMGLAVASATQFVVVWGDGRGLDGTYGLTHVYSCTLTAQL